VRLAFVLSEHPGGVDAEQLAGYRRVERRLGELARAHVASVPYAGVDRLDADAVVVSGSSDPWSAHAPDALERFRDALRAYDGPVLGICAGMQTLAVAAGGEVGTAAEPTGPAFARVEVVDGSDLLAGLDPAISVWEHHTDEITSLPPSFRVLARSATCAVEAIAATDRPWWGTQFHPEEWTDERPAGRVVLESFLRLAGVPLR
jgi:GMP synthase (glutamine-hydrolysing)